MPHNTRAMGAKMLAWGEAARPKGPGPSRSMRNCSPKASSNKVDMGTLLATCRTVLILVKLRIN
eukprot:3994772-Amphidinium_carterae.1